MMDILAIVRRNFLSPIVIAILTLAIILMVLNDLRDAVFLSGVVIINTLIAITQETRARFALKKLELISAPRAHLLGTGGAVNDVMFDQLTVGDRVKLGLGDEVPADGKLLSSDGLEVDESILTGESGGIEKPEGTLTYAASAVISGNAVMQVDHIGPDTRVGKMAATLKRYKPTLTPVQHSIAQAITWLTYGALFLAILIFVVYYFAGQDAVLIFKTITSAAVVVVPEGLLLASSLLLAYGAIRLARAKVLPQKLSAIEAMALVDILCVDKTGTLTSDKIKFEDFELFDDSISNADDLVGIVAKETSSTSSTGVAVIKSFPIGNEYDVIENLAFSSIRKYSGIRVKLKSKKYSILMGAPEPLSQISQLTTVQKKRIDELASEGKRVMLVTLVNDPNASLKSLAKRSGRALGILVLANELRVGVEKTVSYLQKNGVRLKVISGDNPKTVSYIATSAGIFDSQKVLTGTELEKVSNKDWNKVVTETTVFARVLPEQKERLIKTFKRLGNFTGMVGDGVNDALAVKKSDLGVAMYSGAVATRRVADIVLLDNSFNSLPLGMRLGNQIMQAIEIIATLFFHKIIFGVVLLLATLALGIVYPFDPRHITFMSIFLVTLPTIMWTLFSPSPRHRLSPKYFWQDTLLAVAPIAVLSGIMITITYSVLLKIYPHSPHGASTLTVIIATFFGIYLVYLVPRMFDVRNNRKAQLARLLYTVTVLIVIIPSFSLRVARDFFNFSLPNRFNDWPFLLLILSVAIAQWIIAGRAGKRLREREP